MKHFWKILVVGMLIIPLFSELGYENSETAWAADSQEATSTAGNTGLAELPPGAITIDNQFVTTSNPMIVNGVTGNGKATIDTNTSPATGSPYSQINIKGTYAKLTVTSNEANRLDFSHPFKGRVFMKLNGAQDGLSFFIHNDPNKTTAQTGANEGQTLGVYGGREGYTGNIGTAAYTPDKYALKNSFATEFDMAANMNPKHVDSAFDFVPTSDSAYSTLKRPHMAYAYPGSSVTYDASKPNNGAGYRPVSDSGGWLTEWKQNASILNWSGDPANASVIHHDLQPLVNTGMTSNILDNTWYEFRFESDGTNFSYYLRNPRTGVESAHTTIPIAGTFSDQLKLSANGNKAYWGFGAATGSLPGNASFVFTQTPKNIAGELKQSVLLNGKEISSDSPLGANTLADDNVITPNKTVTFQSKFTQTDGGDGAALPINSWKYNFDSSSMTDLSKAFKEWKDGQSVPVKILDKNNQVLKTVNGTVSGHFITVDNLSGITTKKDDTVTFQFDLTASKEQYSVNPNKVVSSVLSSVNVGNDPNKTDINAEPSYFLFDPNLAPTLKFSDTSDSEKTLRAGTAFKLTAADENQAAGDKVTVYYQKAGQNDPQVLTPTNDNYVLPATDAGSYELFAKDTRGVQSNRLTINQTVDQPTILGWSDGLDQNNLAKDLGTHQIDQPLTGTFYWKDPDLADAISFMIVPAGKELTPENVVVTLPAQSADNTTKQQQFSIPADKLTYQGQQFQIAALKDGKVVSQNPLTFAVNNQGSLSLVSVTTGGTDQNLLSWESTLKPGAYTYSRKTGNDLTLQVKDTREGNQTWSVGATVLDPSSASAKFKLLWKANGSDSEQTLSNTSTSVLNPESAGIQKAGNLYTETWDANHGVLLHADETISIGTYKTSDSQFKSVDWNLYDTPNAQ